VASNDRNRVLVIAAGPCTGGSMTSPLCRPTARSRVNVPVGGTHWVRRFTIARPPLNHDAIRVTLTESTQAIPFRPENVGGGGTAELLLNGGTWRYHQGTEWGIVTSPTEGITLSQIKFNSRTYAWSGTARGDVLVHTTIGYAGAKPRWDFQNTMKAGAPFGFRRTPSVPIYSQRTTPRALEFAAAFANEPQFKLTVPLPAWAGSRTTDRRARGPHARGSRTHAASHQAQVSGAAGRATARTMSRSAARGFPFWGGRRSGS
jgi:hypothetical protein